uniref:Tetratricopeptide repeat protein n=1 Tax=viral metagenome TaxID=1070528 RepID=A0A6C0H4P6_9ZZZZ
MEEEFNLIKETRLIEEIKRKNNIYNNCELAKYYGLFETHYEKGIKILTDLVYNNIDLNRNWNDYFGVWKKYEDEEYQSKRIYHFKNCIIYLGLIYYNYGLKENAIECWLYGIKKMAEFEFESDSIEIKSHVAKYYLINNEIDKMKEFLLNEINNNTSFKNDAKFLLGKYYIELGDINNGISLLNSGYHEDLFEYLGIYYYESRNYGIAFTYLKKVQSVYLSIVKWQNWKTLLYLGKYYENIEKNNENAYKYYCQALDNIITFRNRCINNKYLLDRKFDNDEENIEKNIYLLDILVSYGIKK